MPTWIKSTLYKYKLKLEFANGTCYVRLNLDPRCRAKLDFYQSLTKRWQVSSLIHNRNVMAINDFQIFSVKIYKIKDFLS